MPRYLLMSLALFACESENGTKVVNSTPEATITYPGDGASLLEGYTEVLRGTVSDNNHSYDQLTAVWMSGATELCADIVPESDGTVQCETLITADMTEISLQVTDPNNDIGVDSITVTVQATEAPTLSINEPLESETYYSDELIRFAATASDAEDPPELLTVYWTSSIDGDLALPPNPDSNGLIEQLLNLSAGQHAITAIVEDSSGKTSTETIAVRVNEPNTDPLCSINSPLDGDIFQNGQTISFEGTATDFEINNALLDVTWSSDIDGEFYSGSPDSAGISSFSLDSLSSANHTLTFRVEDDAGGLCIDTTQILIDSPPQITINTPNNSDVFNIGDSIDFNATVTDNLDTPTQLALSWTSSIDGPISTQGADSSGIASFSNSSLSTGNHSLSVTVTDSAGLNTTAIVSFMVNAPPSVDGVSITPSSGIYSDSILTCSAVVSDPNETVSAAFTWYVGNNMVGTGSSLSLAGTGAVPGSIVACNASVTDSYGLSDNDFTTVTVENRLPSVSSITLSPSSVYTNDTVTATASFSDQDSFQSISALYEWHVIPYASGIDAIVQSSPLTTLSGSFFSRDDELYVVVTPNDGIDNGPPMTSSSLTVYNSPPSAPTVAISPSPAEESADLECQVTTPSSDADGDSVSYTYQWFVNGSPTSFTTDTISATETTEGDTWLCLVTPTDGTNQGGGNSASATIVQSDSDGDGVLDVDDQCPGFDDNIDNNNNGIPDGCENSMTYSYTGGAQTFVVPSSVEFIHVQAYGAKGGNGDNGVLGGLGGFAEATIPVIPGEVLEVYVGGAGASYNSYGPGGYNGGGSVNECCGSAELSGTGGGASDVRISPYGLNERIIVAGGGGGGGSSDWGSGPGGGGGGLNGEDGAFPVSNNGNIANGTGGTQTAGGIAYQCCGGNYPNQNGSFGQGGACWHDSAACGGGGGGWYGGGAGSFAPGGGGSSYIGWPDSTNANTLTGIQNGNGEIIISYALP